MTNLSLQNKNKWDTFTLLSKVLHCTGLGIAFKWMDLTGGALSAQQRNFPSAPCLGVGEFGQLVSQNNPPLQALLCDGCQTSHSSTRTVPLHGQCQGCMERETLTTPRCDPTTNILQIQLSSIFSSVVMTYGGREIRKATAEDILNSLMTV